MLRRLLLILVISLFILLVALAVLVGGYALASATSDSAGAAVLGWIAVGCLLLIVTDVLLLVGALGVSALSVSGDTEEAS